MKPMNDKETTDEVLQETRRIKEALAKSMDFDLDRILEDARRRQEKKRQDYSFSAGSTRSSNDGMAADSVAYRWVAERSFA